VFHWGFPPHSHKRSEFLSQTIQNQFLVVPRQITTQYEIQLAHRKAPKRQIVLLKRRLIPCPLFFPRTLVFAVGVACKYCATHGTSHREELASLLL